MIDHHVRGIKSYCATLPTDLYQWTSKHSIGAVDEGANSP